MGQGYYKLKNHKPQYDEGCQKLLDQRKEAKLQWLQDPSEINGDKQSGVRCERLERGNICETINELETNRI
jgi:hypothetical protein